MTIQRCSICTLKKDEQQFKRKNKIYKTCNKCSEYCMLRRKKMKDDSNTFDKSTNTMKDKSTNTPPITNSESNMLSRIFIFGHLFPVPIQHKYQHIKQLETELLNEIDVLVHEGLE